MSLDKQLREILSEEGDSRVPPPPDLERLIGGGRARKRRRTVSRVSVALAAVVLLGGSAYGLGQSGLRGSGEKPETAAQPPVLADSDRAPLEPGTRTQIAGTTSVGERIEFAMTLEGSGWFEGDLPLLLDGGHAAGTGAYRPELVAFESACSNDWRGRPASRTLRGLASQLARLPHGTVIQRPTQTRVLGHRALHLSLLIDTACSAASYYTVARSMTVERGISYTEPPTDVSIEFWVVDLDGTTVVVDQWHDIDASQDLVDRATSARESIDFLPVE